MARLIHLNGLPGAGKTTLADRWLDDHPLTLAVDIDLLRTRLGGWREREGTKQLARELAIALIETHLVGGYDVIVPQYLGRLDFIERLAEVAGAADADFVEALLEVDPVEARSRFFERRDRLRSDSRAHPAVEFDDEAAAAIIDDADRALSQVMEARPSVRTVAADGDLEKTYAALVRTLARRVGADRIPEGFELVRTTDVFDNDTVPSGLLRAHRLADGVWGRLVVLAGSIRFTFEEEADKPITVGAGLAVAIAPGRRHHVAFDGPGRFLVEFHRLPTGDPSDPSRFSKNTSA